VWPRGRVELWLYSSMTAALEGDEWSAANPGRTLPPGKTGYPFYRRLGGPQGRSGRAENLVPTGIGSRTVQSLVSRYTDWATRPTSGYIYSVKWYRIERHSQTIYMSPSCILKFVISSILTLSSCPWSPITCGACKFWNCNFVRIYCCPIACYASLPTSSSLAS